MTIFYLHIGGELFVGQINRPPGTSICPTNSFLLIYKCGNPAKYLQQFAKMRIEVYNGTGPSNELVNYDGGG
jgi:hypothetical protein